MKKNSFVEGTIIATVAIVITKILGMLYVIPFYALVGVQGSALYAYAYNIYIIFLEISSAGLPLGVSKVINEFNTLNQLDAKKRAYKIGKKLISLLSIAAFIILFVFANNIGSIILGDLTGGNTVEDVAFVIRVISFSVLIIPYLSVTKGYLQGHKFISVSSICGVIEQLVRIIIILGGSYLGVKVLHLEIKSTIGIALFGAFAGGLSAIIYLLIKMKKNKERLGLNKDYPKDDISNKEILKKIITYALPFVIIDIAISIYSFVDMVLILRTMNYLNFNALDVEFVTSAITTWSGKISMIVNAIAMGMTVSLIPTIVSAYTLKDFKEVNNKLNKALQIIFIVSIPMTIGISMLSSPIWSIFYGPSDIGSIILSCSIFTSLFFNIYMITSSTLQSLNKFKDVYKSTITGFILNALLDVPLMLLFYKLKLPPYLGAILSSIIGYLVSVIIALRILKKEPNISYKKTFNILKRLIISTIIMIVVVYITKIIIPYNINSKLSCIIYISINAIIGAIAYIYINYKNKVLEDVFGKKYLQKIIKKITFGKVNF